jgi:hypothetical protein
MLQVKANHFLCQLIRIAAFTYGHFAELGFLFGSEMYFHSCESRVNRVSLRPCLVPLTFQRSDLGSARRRNRLSWRSLCRL